MAAAPIIKIQDIHKVYGGNGVKTHAVRGISFDVSKGEFISIMGPSGSGKSTLMQILGFLDRPTKGKYFFEGKNTRRFPQDKLAEIRNVKIGFVFQMFNLLPRSTVFENVELPLLYNRKLNSRQENEEKVRAALKSVFMEERIDYFSNQLSGGEKQRVAIARALVNDPELVFADEPTGNLDSKSGLQVMRILQDLNDEGKTVILVTHETYTAQHADRIIKVKDGQIVDDFLLEGRRVAKKEKELK